MPDIKGSTPNQSPLYPFLITVLLLVVLFELLLLSLRGISSKGLAVCISLSSKKEFIAVMKLLQPGQ